MSHCFSVRLIISPPPELSSKLPQALRELKKGLANLKECRCSGGSYLYVCACHETLLKTLLVQTRVAPVLKGGGMQGGPAIEVTLTSGNPHDLVQVLEVVLEALKEYGLPYTFTD